MENEKEKLMDTIIKKAVEIAQASGADLSKPKEVTITLTVQNKVDSGKNGPQPEIQYVCWESESRKQSICFVR